MPGQPARALAHNPASFTATPGPVLGLAATMMDLKHELIRQQQDLGRGYGHRNTINQSLTDQGIFAFCQEDNAQEAQRCYREAIAEQKKLDELDISPAERAELVGSSAQEIVELSGVMKWWPYIIIANYKSLHAITPPGPKDFPMPRAAYLFGLCDVPSELWKQLGYYTATHDLAMAPLWQRLKEVAREIHRTLVPFTSFPDSVTKNTRRNGSENSFEGKICWLATKIIPKIVMARLMHQTSDRLNESMRLMQQQNEAQKAILAQSQEMLVRLEAFTGSKSPAA